DLIEEYGTISEQYEKLGGYEADFEIEKILAGLKLDPETTGHIHPYTSLNEVSSGQKNRILIGQALFAQPDLLVLDDPTSHLDVDSVNWLASYIKGSPQASLIATNNIPFINACSNRLVEITHFGRVLSFKGNYPDYVEKRDRLLTAEKAEADSVQAEKDRIEETYNKFKAKQVFKRSSDMAATGRAMQSRISRLNEQYESMPGSKQVFRTERIPNIVFESKERSGDDVVTIRNLVKNYGDFTALDLRKLELTIQRGELFLLSGDNGSGKSTLLRMIAAAIQNDPTFTPDSGEIEVGANIMANYYAPDQTGIRKSGSIFEEVTEVLASHNESNAAAILHYWGFPKGTIRMKTIEQLSAGEKKQLALAKIMAQHPNLLLLDEPTDYLKPEVVERLAKALEGYDGTTILVSHNPEFKKLLPISRELQLPSGKLVLK
ncbi:MAG TPA: ATP-binding cassette domain-containing protein, partial [Candidatus Woesebacteria bacterium]|nr:ATP-binding cassette domain-containing protein [Candidatus Woesebacteria bacterium]